MRFQKDFILIVICTLFILLLRRIQKFWQCIRLLGNWAWKNMFGFLFWNLLLCRMELPELYDRGAEGSFQKFAICYLFIFARGYVPIYPCKCCLPRRPYSNWNDGLKCHCCGAYIFRYFFILIPHVPNVRSEFRYNENYWRILRSLI